MSVINAWILYKKAYNPKVGQKAFRLFIIEEWLEDYRNFIKLKEKETFILENHITKQ